MWRNQFLIAHQCQTTWTWIKCVQSKFCTHYFSCLNDYLCLVDIRNNLAACLVDHLSFDPCQVFVGINADVCNVVHFSLPPTVRVSLARSVSFPVRSHEPSLLARSSKYVRTCQSQA